jgi:hypothetical protein
MVYHWYAAYGNVPPDGCEVSVIDWPWSIDGESGVGAPAKMAAFAVNEMAGELKTNGVAVPVSIAITFQLNELALVGVCIVSVFVAEPLNATPGTVLYVAPDVMLKKLTLNEPVPPESVALSTCVWPSSTRELDESVMAGLEFTATMSPEEHWEEGRVAESVTLKLYAVGEVGEIVVLVPVCPLICVVQEPSEYH